MAGQRVLIVGGGMGGTAAGIALRRKGIDAVVFERAARLSHIQVGGSYLLWYAGMLSLRHLGLAEQVQEAGHRIDRFELCDAQGGMISGFDIGSRGRELGATPVAVRRADVLRTLTDALGDEALQLGCTYRDAVQDAVGVTATFTDGRRERGGILVGADGIGSAVRAHLHGFEPPKHPGYGHWSGISESTCGAPPHAFRILHGEGARFAYFHAGDGRVCWWCVRNAPEGEEGDVVGSHQALSTFFRSWEPTVPALLAETPPSALHRRDTLDRPPLRRWGRGRITLIGDAAHAMTFNLAQGAGTSLTDGVTLAEHLAGASDPVRALRDFERHRRRVTNPLVRTSRQLGWMAAWDWPLGPQINAAITRAGKPLTHRWFERDLRGHPALTAGAPRRTPAGARR